MSSASHHDHPQFWPSAREVSACAPGMRVSVRPGAALPKAERGKRDPAEPPREVAPELRTVLDDLAAFQEEEMLALQSCLDVLLHKGPREEAATAHVLHLAARQRTRQCLLRLRDWKS